jgi:hypothetical protein
VGNFESIHALIQDFSKEHSLGHKLLEARLKDQWPSIAGQTIAKHSSPDSIRFHKLYLVAENSVWLQQLVFLKPTILQTLQTLMPELSLTDIVLRLGTLPPPMPKHPEAIETPIPTPSSEHLALAKQLAKRVADPQLREAISLTIAKSLSDTAGTSQ